MDQNKKCSTCKKIFSKSCFYKVGANRKYFSKDCKDCYLEIRREYNKEKSRSNRKSNPEKYRAQVVKYKKENHEKVLAHQRVHKALKSGKIKKQKCRDCKRIDTQAHHPDYSKPLVVIWLCPSHHKLLHGRL